ncbi:protein NETWORKED 2A [Hevea brasiliensis]|uniref:protein NETWORKED 2A n=1 Tax=Hevea brasiliensis TaxID=3981 RepID=UPI002600AF5B|nr:protein NETWORKED 2A [Hevea brasiliensis]
MLQRAASNAYSWWWASHIRTKQSKWLEENLQDMEERVTNMLKIIENDGDSFAERAEMYYRKRPELIGHVEDSYRSYRALAERYNLLSREMQSANRTIAAVFPEQVQYEVDDYDDNEANNPASTSSDDAKKPCNVSKRKVPEVPPMPKKEFKNRSSLLLKRAQLNRTSSTAKAAAPPCSGLSQEEAIEEIDKIQKEILALQTEREFVQSIYERSYAKCSKIDNQITDMQARVSSLQDEFGIGNVIDDDEARTLMAATALKSCQETLVKLQEKQEQSAQEAKVESRRVKEMIKKFSNLQGEFHSDETNLRVPTVEKETESENIDQPDTELLRKKIKKELEADSNSSLTVMQLAGRIDELVDKVVSIETAVSSQHALINVLRSEADGLQENIKTLEEEKEILMENSEIMSNKLKELEEEMHRVKSLDQNVKDQNQSLQSHFTVASCKIDHLTVKLQTVKPDEDVENAGMTKDEVAEVAAPDTETDGESKEKEEKKDEVTNSIEAKGFDPNQKSDDGKKDLSHAETNLDNLVEELGNDEEEDQPNWRRLFASGLEDREKLLLEEYMMVLRNYKGVRKRLGDVEKKNRDGFFELALQIRELKNALSVRDEEIQSLRKLSFLQKHEDENNDINSTKDKYSVPIGSPESTIIAPSILDSNHSNLSSPHQPIFESAHEHHIESRRRMHELAAIGGNNMSDPKEIRNEIKMKSVDTLHIASAIEEKIRLDIDGLLEENLEFWLRFSTSFHQIQKFHTSVQDLKTELAKLTDSKSQDGSGKNKSLISEARPIYRHLRQIQTELTLWLETNSVFKEELHGRYASLCSIQEELSRVMSETSKAEEPELSVYQAAKFQGEILNMKQENKKVAGELQAGVDRVIGLKDEVEKTLSKMDDELGFSESKQRSIRSRIPLRSFLFGVKLKRHKRQKSASLFACAFPEFDDLKYDMPVEEHPQ